jgi:hypothetical protein
MLTHELSLIVIGSYGHVFVFIVAGLRVGVKGQRPMMNRLGGILYMRWVLHLHCLVVCIDVDSQDFISRLVVDVDMLSGMNSLWSSSAASLWTYSPGTWRTVSRW